MQVNNAEVARSQELRTLRSIAAANYHRPGLRIARLFDAEPRWLADLVCEVWQLRADHVPSLPSRRGHVTEWVQPRGRVEQHSLVTASGRYDDFSRDHDLSCFGKRFRDHARYPLLGRLIDDLPHLVNMRVNVLGVGAALPPHEEHSVVRSVTGAVGIRARFHLPLITGAGATLTLDGLVYQLAPGGVYFVNHGCVHAAVNNTDAERVHVVWDMLLTADAIAIMFGYGPVPAGLRRRLREEWGVDPSGRMEITCWNQLPDAVPEQAISSVGPLDVQ
jgi:hypothetical protein